MLIDPVTWAEKYFFFESSDTYQGRFQIGRAPWLRDIMLSFADPTCRSGACRCSAQSAKTKTGMILALWSLAEDPGPFLWLLPAQDDAKTFSTTRLKETIERCEPLNRLTTTNRYDFNNLEINFATAPLILTGAGSDSKISGKPIKYLFVDEEKNMKKGQVSKALKRVRSKWDSKVWRMSTSDHEDDTIDLAFKDGDQRYWHVRCPLCEQADYLRFSQMKYIAEGLNIKEIYYKCPTVGCEHRWYDTPSDRDWISSQGVWVPHNPLAPIGRRSWTWNAILPKWVEWSEIVTEWLQANIALSIGDKTPLRTFMNETATEPWKEEYAVSKPVITVSKTYSVKEFAVKGTKIDNELVRFATIDRGLGHWWCLIRAWRNDGTSRALAYEQVPTYDRLKAMLQLYEVQPRFTYQDCGYERDKVLRECSDNNWIAVHGLGGKDSFSHTIKNVVGKPIRKEERLFSPFEFFNVGPNRPPARLINLASQRLKDITAHLRSGNGKRWEVPHDIGGVYLHQLTKEGQEEELDHKTGNKVLRWQEGVSDNHSWDCEYYQTAAAIIYGIDFRTVGQPNLTETLC